jgi:hypothetical protein
VPFSSGVFTPYTPGNPVVTGTTISSTVQNNTTNDIATGLSTCVLKDGSQTMTANLPMANFKITGIGAATTLGDALSYGRAATVTTLTATGNVSTTDGFVFGWGSLTAYVQGSSTIGYVDLLTGGVQRLRADSSGISVTGAVVATGNIKTADNGAYVFGADGSYIQGSTAGDFIDVLIATAQRMRVMPTGIKIFNSTAPSTPTGGGVLYVESGALKYIGSGGTVTTLGPA